MDEMVRWAKFERDPVKDSGWDAKGEAKVVKEGENRKQPKWALEAHLGILGSLTVADKLLVACLDSDVVEHTPDELLELIWGR